MFSSLIVKFSFIFYFLEIMKYYKITSIKCQLLYQYSFFDRTFVIRVRISSWWLFILLFIVEAKFIPFLFGHQTLFHSTAQIVLGLQPADGGRALVLAQADHVPEVGGLAFAVMVEWEWTLFRRWAFELFGTEHIGSHRNKLLSGLKWN